MLWAVYVVALIADTLNAVVVIVVPARAAACNAVLDVRSTLLSILCSLDVLSYSNAQVLLGLFLLFCQGTDPHAG